MIFFLICYILAETKKIYTCIWVNKKDSISTCLKTNTFLFQFLVWKPFYKEFIKAEYVLNVIFKTLNFKT